MTVEKGLKRLTLVLSLLAGPFVFFCICDDWPEPLLFFLLLLIFEVIGFVAVWIIYCPMRWIVKGFNDEEKKLKEKAFDWNRGLRRITLLLSIIVGLAMALLGFDLFDDEVRYYRDQYEDNENIVRFWKIWDANGWDGGRKSVIQHILDSEDEYRGALFSIRDESFYLKPYKAFPGIHKDMLDMSSFDLDVKTQAIKRNAIQRAKKNMEEYAYWGEKTLFEIALFGIGIALLVGVIGFSLVWLLFCLIRWLILGFCTEKTKHE